MKKSLLLLFISLSFQFGYAQNWETSLPTWMEELAGDGMLGRGNDRPEINLAADWIAKKFEENGLKPGVGKSYLQSYYLTPRNRQDSFLVKNVIGILPAKKKSDEYILLTAHYDHLGIGRVVDGDSIYNGANDNASGVLAMIGIAAELRKKNLNRNIIIIAFSGEEMGLRGSRYFANNPTINFQKAIANFNFEMIGQSEVFGKKKFYMTGADYSTLAAFTDKVLEGNEWQRAEDPFPDFNLFYRSDNASLATIEEDKENKIFKGIPAHTYCTWGGEDSYHQPKDGPEIIDYENMAGFIKATALVVEALANSKETIDWKHEQFVRP